jgi:cysteine-rich repeat protein
VLFFSTLLWILSPTDPAGALTAGNTSHGTAAQHGRQPLTDPNDSRIAASLESDAAGKPRNSAPLSGGGFASVAALAFDPDPPPLCQGYGNPVVIATETWDSYAVGDTGPWTADTRGVIDPDFFFDPAYPPVAKTWTVTASLPDERPGQSAFVPNRVSGDCGTLDETGAMMLDGPTIEIPDAAQVPRLVVDHWLASEDLYAPDYYDGGNFKFSVNGGDFLELPPGAIEFNGYNETLVTAGNDNPLAGEAVFAGTDPSSPPANWGQSHINLSAIASPGSTVALRLDFGVDACDGVAGGGWYVDDLQYYYCSDELPPSDCGNALLDAGEQCDDGNDFIGDGCSNTCQVEPGWTCSAPLSPGGISDPGFELGPDPSVTPWSQASLRFDDILICDEATCNTLQGSGPADGSFWAWLGGWVPSEAVPAPNDESRLSQTITIPSHAEELRFDLALTYCDSSDDYMEVLIDQSRIFITNGGDANPLCGQTEYTTQVIDLSGFADGGSHVLEFHSETFATNGEPTNFLVDNVRIPPIPSQCEPLTTQLTLVKDVVKDHGGNALPSAWTLAATGPASFSGPGPSVSSDPGIPPGSYDLSESGGEPGYAASAWVCEGGTQFDDNTVVLAENDAVTCTITNDDIAPTLTVQKVCDPVDDGGRFRLLIDGSGSSNTACGGSYGPIEVTAGAHVVSEGAGPGTDLADYMSTIGGDCTANGSVTLALGEDKTCTISNVRKPSLTLVKTVTNDNGGMASADSFQARIDGGDVPWGVAQVLEPGNHQASEVGLAGYAASGWGGNCAANGSIALSPGQNATCSITNDDIAPTLTLIKTVINDDGGTLGVSQFPLFISGSPAVSGQAVSLDAGSYVASETSQPGYAASAWSGDCDGAGNVTLGLADNKTCTITNNDIAPTLTVFKNIVNDNVGNETNPDAFGLKVDGNLVLHGVANSLSAGQHLVSEDGLPGYTPGTWSGDCAPDGSITLAPGETATCSISNDDVAGTSLTLVKQVRNDDGGTAPPGAWTLRADGGPTPIAGSGPNVSSGPDFLPGTYTLSETGGQPGYTADAWSCSGGSQNGNQVTLEFGESAICTIVNDDIAPTLTLVKTVINDNGGTLGIGDFPLFINGAPAVSGQAVTLKAGNYLATETSQSGYAASTWGGDCNAAGNVTLSLGQNKTCTITNDDIAQGAVIFEDGFESN